MAERMLTTTDNPYDPFTQWDQWDAYDRSLGYHTTAVLARFIVSSDELPEALQSQAYEDAIDDFLEVIVTGTEFKYKTVEAPRSSELAAS